MSTALLKSLRTDIAVINLQTSQANIESPFDLSYKILNFIDGLASYNGIIKKKEREGREALWLVKG